MVLPLNTSEEAPARLVLPCCSSRVSFHGGMESIGPRELSTQGFVLLLIALQLFTPKARDPLPLPVDISSLGLPSWCSKKPSGWVPLGLGRMKLYHEVGTHKLEHPHACVQGMGVQNWTGVGREGVRPRERGSQGPQSWVLPLEATELWLFQEF